MRLVVKHAHTHDGIRRSFIATVRPIVLQSQAEASSAAKIDAALVRSKVSVRIALIRELLIFGFRFWGENLEMSEYQESFAHELDLSFFLEIAVEYWFCHFLPSWSCFVTWAEVSSRG